MPAEIRTDAVQGRLKGAGLTALAADGNPGRIADEVFAELKRRFVTRRVRVQPEAELDLLVSAGWRAPFMSLTDLTAQSHLWSRVRARHSRRNDLDNDF